MSNKSSVKDILRKLFVLALTTIALGWTAKLVLAFLHNGVIQLIGVFKGLAKQDTALVVALVTGGVSIVTVIIGTIANSWLSYRSSRSEYLRIHREGPYKRLVKIFYDYQMRQISDNPMSQQELIEAMNEFNQELTLWGSSKAIREWGRWRVDSGKGKLDGRNLLFGMERVIRQIRKDLGQTQWLREGDILRLFVNDIDDYLKK